MADSIDKVNFSSIPLFEGLDRIELAKVIPSFTLNSFVLDEVLFRQGDAGDSLFIIVRGLVQVIRGHGEEGEQEIAVMGHGQCVGEMALLSGDARSATVKAATELTALRLAKEDFDELLLKHPSLSVHFAALLASRRFKANYAPTVDTVTYPDEEEQGAAARGGSAGFCFGRKTVTLAVGAVVCTLAALLMNWAGFSRDHIILGNLLLAATVVWTFDLVPYHAVSLSLPMFTVLLGVSPPERAFSGFSKPYWFLALGVFALSAAIFRTGLLYRMALKIMRAFPPGYLGQTFALALAGFLLTPLVPSAYARSILASPVALTMSETMRFKKDTPPAVGIAMACLLGFGHMSFVFLNGTASCAFVLGLMPAAVQRSVTWGSWLLAALPFGTLFFLLSYLAITLLYRPEAPTSQQVEVLDAQLKTLGPMTAKEKITLATIALSLLGFSTEHWHHVDEAWVALIGFIIVFATQVIDEHSIRTDMDWSFLLSLGGMVGFGDIITDSGFDKVLVQAISPYLELFTGSITVSLVVVSLTVHLIRCALPLTPGILVSMLAVVPILTSIGVSPLVSGLVILASANPWLLKQQNSVYRNVWKSTGSKLFHHEDTLKLALLHIPIVALSVAVSVPYWRYLGLLRG